MKHFLFRQPDDADSANDAKFAMRCLWALDPNRHLFTGDFRDYARIIFERRLTSWDDHRELPKSCAEEIADLAKTFPCSDPTRRCWRMISIRMRRHAHNICVMRFGNRDEDKLAEFVSGAFDYYSGPYCVIRENIPEPLAAAAQLGFNATLEAVASDHRPLLDPRSFRGAILLWTLWCLETKWPDWKKAGHLRTTFSLSWQLAREVDDTDKEPKEWGIARLISLGSDLQLADELIRSTPYSSTIPHCFVQHATVEQFDLLVGIPLDEPAKWGLRPIHEALRNKKWRIAEWLLDHGANPNSQPDIYDPAIVLWAEENGPNFVLKKLLKFGADISLCGRCRRTALHTTAYAGNLRCCRALMARGANIEALDTWGHTPVYRAVFAMVAGEGSRLPVIKALLAAGANRNPSDSQGLGVQQFLQRACEFGLPRTVFDEIFNALNFP